MELTTLTFWLTMYLGFLSGGAAYTYAWFVCERESEMVAAYVARLNGRACSVLWLARAQRELGCPVVKPVFVAQAAPVCVQVTPVRVLRTVAVGGV